MKALSLAASGAAAAKHRGHRGPLHRAREASGPPVARAAVEVRLVRARARARARAKVRVRARVRVRVRAAVEVGLR